MSEIFEDLEPQEEVEEPVEENGEEPAEEGKKKAKKKRQPKAKTTKKNRKTKAKPGLKDWLRLRKSQGNAQPNKTVHLIINKATMLCEVVTNAPSKEGSEEMEGERVQVFQITSYEEIDDPNRNPLREEKAEGEGNTEGESASDGPTED